MATEIPQRYTLRVALFIGSQQDMTKGFVELAKQLPDHIEAVEDGWKVTGVSPKFFEQVKAIFKEDKIKFTEDFEMNFMFYLGWVSARRFTTLHLSQTEPAHHLSVSQWKWTGHKAVKHESSDGS